MMNPRMSLNLTLTFDLCNYFW